MKRSRTSSLTRTQEERDQAAKEAEEQEERHEARTTGIDPQALVTFIQGCEVLERNFNRCRGALQRCKKKTSYPHSLASSESTYQSYMVRGSKMRSGSSS